MTETPVCVEPDETLLCFDGMLGVLAMPKSPQPASDVGLVIVVGGPQTRVGSHRQFVTMARALARAGYPCLRFDYTGLGDSAGPLPDFERVGPDIAHACDVLQRSVPQCRRVVLWGLCEGATAALFHALVDARIAAVVAANPWARSDDTRSAAIVKQHYGSRLRSREFWTRLATGKVDVAGSVREAAGHLFRFVGARRPVAAGEASSDLAGRVAHALARARCPIRLQLSGNDLTAAEFEAALGRTMSKEPPHVSRLRLDQADHTCSDPADWEAVVADTIRFLTALGHESGRSGR